MTKDTKNTIKSLVIAILLLAAGFVGGTVVFDGIAVDPIIRERPWFVEDTGQAVSQTVALNQSDLATTDRSELAQQTGLYTEFERVMSDVYSRVSPSVVSISVRRNTTGIAGLEEGSSGSGFVIDLQGHIVTNYHVVNGADEIVANFLDGTIVRAEVVGLDADSDIAVIRVDLPQERLNPVTFGSEKDLVIGQVVVAIGSPFQQRWTMTSGIISALDRDIRGLGLYSVGSVIQTDASINPGNSGGPLLNLAGEVVGVNSQIISETRSNSGIGFAVPSTLVQRVVQEIIATGRVEYSYMGISIPTLGGGDLTIEIIEQYNLANNQRGVVVLDVQPGGPAAQAGLRTLTNTSIDIITAIDGTPITGFSNLIGYLAEETFPGDTITATVLRDGQLVDIPIVLSRRPE